MKKSVKLAWTPAERTVWPISPLPIGTWDDVPSGGIKETRYCPMPKDQKEYERGISGPKTKEKRMKVYVKAVQQGYKGTFSDWLIDYQESSPPLRKIVVEKDKNVTNKNNDIYHYRWKVEEQYLPNDSYKCGPMGAEKTSINTNDMNNLKERYGAIKGRQIENILAGRNINDGLSEIVEAKLIENQVKKSGLSNINETEVKVPTEVKSTLQDRYGIAQGNAIANVLYRKMADKVNKRIETKNVARPSDFAFKAVKAGKSTTPSNKTVKLQAGKVYAAPKVQAMPGVKTPPKQGNIVFDTTAPERYFGVRLQSEDPRMAEVKDKKLVKLT